MRKLITGLLLLLLVVVSFGCAREVTPPAPVPTPAPGPERTIMFDRVLDVIASYGEKAEINLSFTNEASEPRTLSPFPPEIKIIELPNVKPPDVVVRGFPVGTGERVLQPSESESHSVDWDQKNENGEQVPPGWYSVEVTLATSRGSPVGVLVLPPEGVMEKTIEVNQSETVNGITITLERVELTSTSMKVYAFNTPPDYNLPQGPMLPPPMFMIHADAEYSVDGSPFKETFTSGIGFFDEGVRHVWGEYLDPVPANAKELTFRVTKLGDWQGPWEFQIQLENSSVSQNKQPVDIVSLVVPLQPINPGGPIVEITLKNASTEPVIALSATLELSRSFTFDFGVTSSNPLPASESVSSRRTLIGGGFSDVTTYSLTIDGTLQNGATFAFTKQVRIAAP